MTDNSQLTIRFGGDGNIKVDTLTDFLEIYKELIFIVNHQLGYSNDDLIIEVSPPENGSFKIKISPKYQKLLLRSFETIVVSTIGGLLLYFLTKNDDGKTLEEIRDLLQKQTNDPTIINNVYNIYENSGAEQKIQQSFAVVNGDDNVTSLKIDQDGHQIIDVPKSQFPKLINTNIQENYVLEPRTDILKDEAVLVIKTIHFEGNAKWVFVFRGYTIKASIKDAEFLSKLNNEAFRKGDNLRVTLARTRIYDEDLQTYMVDESTYVIEKVIEHISKTDNQSKLDFK
ncbi:MULTISPECIES: hypothetical protein [unclassified Flavobacterium]|uniref:hypothetical protein n=1 Tax=unclassified Flavobacterium TaxID=196869 RepID=UPI001F128DB3|nr:MULTISPECIES: hypothetical protein [unclassified Flavobacterium]UMY65112.1 hypothetical protein MKO97_11410 [Flavobacterium sp. HJ-32-4]